MTAHFPRSRRALAVGAGTALATAVALLPNVSAAAAETEATSLSYVVNVQPGHGPSARVERAIAKAGGTVVTSYDRIGVIVVHSANPDFARTLRKVPGVQSAGNTRNAPLPAQSTTDVGTPKVLGAAEQLSSQSKDLAGQFNRFLSEVRAA